MKLLITNGPIIDGLGHLLTDSAVLVEGDRIRDVGREVAQAKGRVDSVIDLCGRTLLPGLLDLHTHMIGGDCADGYGDEAKSFRMEEPLTTYVMRSVAAAEKTLQCGFTTVREVIARDFIDVDMKKAIGQGIIRGPRMITCGKGIAPTGGHGSFMGNEVDGVDEVRKEVRRQIKRGVDWLKIVGVDGPEATGKWATEQFTYEEIATAVEEIHRVERYAAAHCMGEKGIANAVRAGVDTIEHCWFISEANCELMKEKGAWLVTTISNVDYIANHGPKHGMAWSAGLKQQEEEIYERFKTAYRAGVKIACGSDCGGNESKRHGTNAEELEWYVRLGIPPMEAITIATGRSAEAARFTEVGAVQPGRYADFVIVDGDPLKDISLLSRKIDSVIKGGEIVHQRGA